MAIAARTLDDALVPFFAFARQAGMALPALLDVLARDKSVQQAVSKLAVERAGAADTDAAKELPSIFDMSPDDVRAEVDAALQEARRREKAARDGDLSMEGLPLPVTQTRTGDLLDVVHRLQVQAQASGLGEMTLDEINEEIAAARRERRERETRQMEAETA